MNSILQISYDYSQKANVICSVLNEIVFIIFIGILTYCYIEQSTTVLHFYRKSDVNYIALFLRGFFHKGKNISGCE